MALVIAEPVSAWGHFLVSFFLTFCVYVCVCPAPYLPTKKHKNISVCFNKQKEVQAKVCKEGRKGVHLLILRQHGGLIDCLYFFAFGIFLASIRSMCSPLLCPPRAIIPNGPCSPNWGCVTTLRSKIQKLITQCWLYRGWATKHQKQGLPVPVKDREEQRIYYWLCNLGTTVNNRHCEADEKNGCD